MAEEAEIESLKALVVGARARGDTKSVESLLGKLRDIKSPQLEAQARTKSAQSRVKVDPLAGLRKGGPGFVPDVLRPFKEQSYESQLAPDFSVEDFDERGARDPWRGVAGVGRGVENLIQGSKQIGYNAAEGIGRMMEPELAQPRMMQDPYTTAETMPRESYLQEENWKQQEIIRGKRARDNDAYENLTRGYEGSMMLSEIVGETAPFLGLPVGRLAGPVASGAGRIINPVVRATPEVLAGAGEAAIPYAQSDEERIGRSEEGAVGAIIAKTGLDYLAKRANVRRERMETPELQELHDLGQDFGIPIRTGGGIEQRELAAGAAESRTGMLQSDTDLAEKVQGEIKGVIGRKKIGQDEQYDSLFNVLDKADNLPSQRNSMGRFMPRGALDMNPIRRNVNARLTEEVDMLGMADDSVLKEYEKWFELPDNVNMSTLHRFRTGLRERTPTTNTYAAGKFRELDELIGEQMADYADKIQPGSGEMLRNMDQWYQVDMPALMKNPAIADAFADSPSPDSMLRWMMGAPDATRREAVDLLTPAAKDAVTQAFWNKAYRGGLQGREFNPLQYAKYVEQHLDSARLFMPIEEIQAFEGLGKVMRHIASEGASPDASLLKLIRGYPFMYRAITDRVTRSNFVYMLQNVPPDITPGSPAMDRWYRGFVRGLAVQEPGGVSGPLFESGGGPEAIDSAIGRSIGALQSLRGGATPGNP